MCRLVDLVFLSSIFLPESQNVTLLLLHYFLGEKGKKLTGPGSRMKLPKSEEIDSELGLDVCSIFKSLQSKVADSQLFANQLKL